MANEPISALTLFTSYSTADEVEILDVSDTTFASTGTESESRSPHCSPWRAWGAAPVAVQARSPVSGFGAIVVITVTGSPVSTRVRSPEPRRRAVKPTSWPTRGLGSVSRFRRT